MASPSTVCLSVPLSSLPKPHLVLLPRGRGGTGPSSFLCAYPAPMRRLWMCAESARGTHLCTQALTCCECRHVSGGDKASCQLQGHRVTSRVNFCFPGLIQQLR